MHIVLIYFHNCIFVKSFSASQTLKFDFTIEIRFCKADLTLTYFVRKLVAHVVSHSILLKILKDA